jgi:alanine dehydrogenase
MSHSPFSREELLPQEEKLAITRSDSRLFIAFAKASSLQERRAPISPAGVAVLVSNQHTVLVESHLGDEAGYPDQLYAEAGAIVTADLKELYAASVLVKVDPPSEEEIKRMRNGALLVSALQIKTRKRSFFEQLLQKNITAIALEYIEDGHGGYPFVESLGEISGTSSILIAAELLVSSQKAKGILFGNISGVKPLTTVVVGASTAGIVAAKTALALGSNVELFDVDITRLRLAKQHISPHLSTQLIAETALAQALKRSDVVIGALSGERRAPVVVNKAMVDQMQEGSVIIDISIDSGGCIETSELTTHDHPTTIYNGVIHYGVPNIPSRYPRSSTDALNALITPFILKLSYYPRIEDVLAKEATIASGVYCYKNKATKPSLNDWFGFDYYDLKLYLL